MDPPSNLVVVADMGAGDLNGVALCAGKLARHRFAVGCAAAGAGRTPAYAGAMLIVSPTAHSGHFSRSAVKESCMQTPTN